MARRHLTAITLFPILALAPACTTSPGDPAEPPAATERSTQPASDAAPPPRTQAWMDRLTVPHHYDPSTGFIVADRVTPLPDLFTQTEPAEAVRRADQTNATAVLVATADRCAPCQQYKLDALNNPAVLDKLRAGPFTAAHIEVDTRPELADRLLGSRAIPVTYALRDGRVIATLPGQRSPEDLLAWLDSL